VFSGAYPLYTPEPTKSTSEKGKEKYLKNGGKTSLFAMFCNVYEAQFTPNNEKSKENNI